jgi:hypothetical protein
MSETDFWTVVHGMVFGGSAVILQAPIEVADQKHCLENLCCFARF